MKLTLKRIYKRPDYTIGYLYIDDIKFCDTLEDTDRLLYNSMSLNEIKSKKIKDRTAIPYGTYTIDMNTVSPTFKNKYPYSDYKGIIPRLLNVNGFEGILIHAGNNAEHTSGCVLVGENKLKGKVCNSIATYSKLFNILNKANKNNELITINIINNGKE